MADDTLTKPKKPKVSWQQKTHSHLTALHDKNPQGTVHIGDLESSVNPPSRKAFQDYVKDQIAKGNIAGTANADNPSLERTAMQDAYDKTVGVPNGAGRPLVNLAPQNNPFVKGAPATLTGAPQPAPATAPTTPAGPAAPLQDGIPDFLRRYLPGQGPAPQTTPTPPPGPAVSAPAAPTPTPATPAAASTAVVPVGRSYFSPPAVRPNTLPATVPNGSMTPSSGSISPPAITNGSPALGSGANPLVPRPDTLPSDNQFHYNGPQRIEAAKTGSLDPWGSWTFNKTGSESPGSAAGVGSGGNLPTSTPRLPAPPVAGAGLAGAVNPALAAFGPVTAAAAASPSVYPSIEDLAKTHSDQGGGILQKLQAAFAMGKAQGGKDLAAQAGLPDIGNGPGGGTPVTPTGPQPPASQTYMPGGVPMPQPRPPMPAVPMPQPRPAQPAIPMPQPAPSTTTTGPSAWGMSPSQYGQATGGAQGTPYAAPGMGKGAATGPVPQTTPGPNIIQSMLTKMFGNPPAQPWDQNGANTASGF